MSDKCEYYIRFAQGRDKKAWLSLWPDYVDQYIPTPEALDITWERLLDNRQDLRGLFLFSVDSDEMVGFLHYVLHRTSSYEGYDCYIEDVTIAPAHRCRGGFGILYAEFVRQIELRGDCRIIHWRTRAKNYVACAAYDKVAERTDWVRYEHRLFETNIKLEKENE